MTQAEYDAEGNRLREEMTQFLNEYREKLDAMHFERETKFREIADRCRNIIERK